MVPDRKKGVSLRIHVRSLDGKRGPERAVLRKALRKAAEATLDPGRFVVEIAYADDLRMKRLNRRFHGRNGTTDVLAFPSFMETPEGLHLGEIVVNRDAARRSRDEGGGVFMEMLRYAVHGFLHLAGYDDHSPEDKRKMWRLQESIIELCRGKSVRRTKVLRKS